MRASGERGRGDDKLQATISLSVKRLENYMRVSYGCVYFISVSWTLKIIQERTKSFTELYKL